MRRHLHHFGFFAAALISVLAPAHATSDRFNDGVPAARSTDVYAGAATDGRSPEPETIVDIGRQMTPAERSVAADDGQKAARELPACASDPNVLGLARVVEIDATGGPEFGGQSGRTYDFLRDKEVVLTFDDGPMRSHTTKVLDALAAQCTRATFFMVGRMAAADPAMVKEVIAQGHTAATHTWSHKNLRTSGRLRALQDFEMGVSAVNRASGGLAAPFFRFPYLSESSAVLEQAAERDVATFWIDIDSKDYLTRNFHDVQRRVMAQLNIKGKGIILMHDIQLSTVSAIAPLLDELRRRGFKVVHVVPKKPVTSIAAGDEAVAKALGDKAKALRDNPLADRSVVWAADPGEPTAGRRSTTRRSAKQTTAAPVNDQLPWLQPFSPAAAAPARKKTTAPSSGDKPWQFKPFNY